MVAQLAHQHRGGAHAVVRDAAPHPGNVQPLPRREQGLQEEITVVLPPRAVAGPVVLAHEVEVQGLALAGIIAVVHAQQADQAEGDGAHGHEGGEGDRAGEEALGQAPLVELRQPVFADDGQGQGLRQPRGVGGLLPILEGSLQLEQGEGILAAVAVPGVKVIR